MDIQSKKKPEQKISNMDGKCADIGTFLWLLRLRWAIIASQTCMVLAGIKIFHHKTFLMPVVLIIGLGLTSNIFLYNLYDKKTDIPSHLPLLVMLFDVALLTVLFFQLVSTLNPAGIFFIVYILLGALLLEQKHSYALTAFTIWCYGIFFYFGDPSLTDDHLLANHLHLLENINDRQILTLFSSHIEEHLRSFNYFMFIIFFLLSLLIVYPIGKIKEGMKGQQGAGKELEEAKIRNDKLAALATFAAGAAHEFSTPLSTIAMASGEMMFHFKKHGGDPGLIDDTRLIREQVGRCKEILFQMSAKGGKHLGEDTARFCIDELVSEAMALFSFEELQQIKFTNKVGDMEISMPPRTLTRTLRSLLKNAMDASPPGSPIRLTCQKNSAYLYFEVKDKGTGMDQNFLKRATEPFFTSKEPGKGMGLGLYLADIMANRFGGELKLKSKPDAGTTATLSFALDKIKA